MNEADLRETALSVVRNAPFPFLATVDGDTPRVRPVSPVRLEGFTVWVASLAASGKTGQIRANKRVELCFMNDSHEQVRVAGTACETDDHGTRSEIWNSYELLQKYFDDPDDPALIIYRIEPARVRYCREWGLEYREVPGV
jgi:general stress protein 26